MHFSHTFTLYYFWIQAQYHIFIIVCEWEVGDLCTKREWMYTPETLELHLIAFHYQESSLRFIFYKEKEILG